MRATKSADQARVGNWLLHAMDRMQQALDAASTGQVVLFFAISLVITPLSVIAHELGHALAARHYGADVSEFVASGEGPSATGSVRGIRVRLGLGLGRDLRSREAQGWVRIDFSTLTPQQMIRVLCAGPAAQALYGALLLVAMVLALGSPVLIPIMFGLCGAGSIVEAVLNLTRDGHGRSDGAKIRAIRAGVLVPAPTTRPQQSPRAQTSVAPPRRRTP